MNARTSRFLPAALAASLAAALALFACDRSSPPAAQSSQTHPPDAAPLNDSSKPGKSAAAQTTPEAPKPSPAEGSSPAHVTAGGLKWAVPAGWSQRTPSSSMRAAEFIIAAQTEPALEPATAAIFVGIKGSVDDNINRWTGQVTEQTAEPIIESFTKGHLTIKHVFARGTYFAGVGMGAGAPIKDAILLGAVVSGGPSGDVHIKVVGPALILEPQRDAWMEMLKSVEPAN